MRQEDLIGKVISEYKVEDRLTSSTHSAIFLVRHIRMDHWRRVMKTLNKHLTRDQRFMRQMKNEQNIVGEFSDSALEFNVRPYDVGVIKNTETHWDNSPYIIMEYVEDGSLKENSQISLEQKVFCIAQATRGLDAAHDEGVIHKDFHDGNVLLVMKKNQIISVKVCDYGVGANMDDTGYYGGYSKAPILYKAPEQTTGGKEKGLREGKHTDVYQVGATLLNITSGLQITEGVIQELYNGYKDVPEPLKDIIKQCISFNPKNRPSLKQVRKTLLNLDELEKETKFASLIEKASQELHGIGNRYKRRSCNTLTGKDIDNLFKIRNRYYKKWGRMDYTIPVGSIEAIINRLLERDTIIMGEFAAPYCNEKLKVVHAPKSKKQREKAEQYSKALQNWQKHLNRTIYVDPASWKMNIK